MDLGFITNNYQTHSSMNKNPSNRDASNTLTNVSLTCSCFINVHFFSFASVKDGVFRQYRGSRGENEIIAFVDDKRWQDTEPVPYYYAPNAPQ